MKLCHFLRDFWQQRPHSGSRQRLDPNLQTLAASRPENVCLGRPPDQVLPAWYTYQPSGGWGGSVSLISMCILGVYMFRWQRKYVDMDPSEFGFLECSLWLTSDHRRVGTFPLCWGNRLLWLGIALYIS
jgi:hypothetical protein